MMILLHLDKESADILDTYAAKVGMDRVSFCESMMAETLQNLDAIAKVVCLMNAPAAGVA